jgi:hypothetical protein
MLRSIGLILGIFLGLMVFSQDYKNLRLDRPDLPAYLIANETDTIGIVFTILDVQKIDKNLELLEYMEKLTSKIDTTQYYYISLVGDLELKVELQKNKILNLISQGVIKDKMIEDLKSQIKLSSEKSKNLEEVVDNKDKIIKEKDEEIGKQKTLKYVFGILGVIGIILVSVL